MQTAAAEPALAAGPLDEQLTARLLQQRIIVLGSEVEDRIANRLCAQLLLLSAEDPRGDIRLYINSPGGSVSAGLAIYDTMRLIPNDVSTLAMGLAASMGQFLLCAEAAGKRTTGRPAAVKGQGPAKFESTGWLTYIGDLYRLGVRAGDVPSRGIAERSRAPGLRPGRPSALPAGSGFEEETMSASQSQRSVTQYLAHHAPCALVIIRTRRSRS